jgi:hypothetical protein
VKDGNPTDLTCSEGDNGLVSPGRTQALGMDAGQDPKQTTMVTHGRNGCLHSLVNSAMVCQSPKLLDLLESRSTTDVDRENLLGRSGNPRSLEGLL